MSLRFALDQLNPAMRAQAAEQIRKLDGTRRGSIDAQHELAPAPPTHSPISKYRNKRCWYEGERFDSLAELERWKALKLMAKAGEIRALRRQVPFELTVADVHICRYIADFVYEDAGPTRTGRRRRDWRTVVEDVKGAQKGAAWQMFQVKSKLMLACHGIEVRVL